MKVNVAVKPGSRLESITENEDGSFTVKVRAPPIDGKANARVIELLAKHFGKPKSSVTLVHGSSGKKKVFEIK